MTQFTSRSGMPDPANIELEEIAARGQSVQPQGRREAEEDGVRPKQERKDANSACGGVCRPLAGPLRRSFAPDPVVSATNDHNGPQGCQVASFW